MPSFSKICWIWAKVFRDNDVLHAAQGLGLFGFSVNNILFGYHIKVVYPGENIKVFRENPSNHKLYGNTQKAVRLSVHVWPEKLGEEIMAMLISGLVCPDNV